MSDTGGIKIMQTVASGGTAVLYKAIQTSLDRVVAVKRLHKHLTNDENFTRRFVLEAKAAASLDHENIVHVIDFGRTDDGYQIVMEFVEGDSLKEVLDRWRPIRHDLALAIGHQVLLGLEHAHAKGIVHRDIKPGNLMLTKTGKVKITDFGLAKLTQAATSHTADDSIIGTPLYMSPEQAFGESVDQRSDLFSLGTVLYELVTGRQPFASENYMGVIQNIINKNIPDVRDLNPDVPGEVEGIVMRALSKDRDRRFQSARELRECIEAYLGVAKIPRLNERLGFLLEKNTATQVMPRPDESVRRPRRPARAYVAAAIATLLLAGTAAVVLEPSLLDRIGVSESTGPDRALIQTSGAVDDVSYPLDLGALVEDVAPTGADSADTAASADSEPPAKAAPPAATPQPPPASQSGAASATHEEPEEPRVRMGYLRVSADPTAEVYVDGRYRGDSPPALRLELPAGRHALELRNPRYETYNEVLRIVPGELSSRNVIMKMLAGSVSLTTQAGAEVYIDGKLVGITPLRRPLDVAAGTHTVSIRKAGFNTWSSEITVEARQTLPLRITLSPSY